MIKLNSYDSEYVSLISCVQVRIHHLSVKVNPICRWDYWGSSFWHSRSTTGHIFSICQYLIYKCEYIDAVCQLFISFEKACDSFMTEVLYNILYGFDIPMKLVGQIEMCLNETDCRVRMGKHLCDMFPLRIVWKKGDALLPLLFNIAIEYTIRRVCTNQDDWKLNGAHKFVGYSYDVNAGRSCCTPGLRSSRMSCKSKLCKLNTKFSFKTGYFLGVRELTTSYYTVYNYTTSRHEDL